MTISFDNYANNDFFLCHPWHAFEMIKLTVMRQKKITNHYDLLNFWTDLELESRPMKTSAEFSQDQLAY